ncbi:unnamed protein product [Amoebophrya sp. A120]|nr:unnamed protein product [Amoebophrya sp. A120]|eukprot:GSA120T00002369001.1
MSAMDHNKMTGSVLDLPGSASPCVRVEIVRIVLEQVLFLRQQIPVPVQQLRMHLEAVAETDCSLSTAEPVAMEVDQESLAPASPPMAESHLTNSVMPGTGVDVEQAPPGRMNSISCVGSKRKALAVLEEDDRISGAAHLQRSEGDDSRMGSVTVSSSNFEKRRVCDLSGSLPAHTLNRSVEALGKIDFVAAKLQEMVSALQHEHRFVVHSVLFLIGGSAPLFPGEVFEVQLEPLDNSGEPQPTLDQDEITGTRVEDKQSKNVDRLLRQVARKIVPEPRLSAFPMPNGSQVHVAIALRRGPGSQVVTQSRSQMVFPPRIDGFVTRPQASYETYKRDLVLRLGSSTEGQVKVNPEGIDAQVRPDEESVSTEKIMRNTLTLLFVEQSIPAVSA